MQAQDTLLVVFFIQLVLVVIGAQVCGFLAEKVGQARVVGEIVSGFLLGPSLFGFVDRGAYDFIFTSIPPQSLYFLGQIGLVLLMFQIGLEFDISHLTARKNRTASLLVALTGLVLSFSLGAVVAWLSRPHLAPSSDLAGYVLFCGTALCVTAVPVLGRIIMDLGISGMAVSGIAMMAASVTDVLAWILLATVVAIVSAKFHFSMLFVQVVLLITYALICLYVVRPLLLRLVEFLDKRRYNLATSLNPILFVTILLSSLITSQLGLHSAFGGLVVGLILHGQPRVVDHWKQSVAGFINVTFVPVFFAYAGSHADVGTIGSWSFLPWFCLFMGAAVIGKFGGSYLAGRLAGLSPMQSRIVGIFMNTRGLIELVVLTVGLELNIIPPSVYTILVIIAIVSTLVTTPLLRLWIPHLNAHQVHGPIDVATRRA